jgi:hypothetical protein
MASSQGKTGVILVSLEESDDEMYVETQEASQEIKRMQDRSCKPRLSSHMR